MNIKSSFQNNEEKIILLDDLDDALVGIGERIGMPPVAIYDSQKCVEILSDCYNMSYKDALEFFEFNISGAYLGESTPIFIRFPEQ